MLLRLLLTLLTFGAACGGCQEAPPFDPDVFITPETIEEFGEVVCDSSIGIVAPLPTCYPQRPCDRVLPIPGRSDEITTPTHVPDCETADEVDNHGPWSDDAPFQFIDRDRVTRRYCKYDPGADAPMPVVLWYHGSGGSADNLYDNTNLREKATTFDLGGPQPGFVLIAIEGRNLHWPTSDPRDGPHHDVFHRDLSNDSNNRDVAMADKLIDLLVDEGVADPRRVYVMGWSNGMHFAQMYGIARHGKPTAGGNYVAAVAGYSAADPFHNRAIDQTPTCQLAEYPRSDVPIMLIGRSCDAVPCSDEQFDRAVERSQAVAPGTSQEAWVRALTERIQDPNVRRIIIDDDGNEVSACEPAKSCGTGRALRNHVRWPDGAADKGGNDWEVEMLDFLAANRWMFPAVEGD